MTQTLIRITQYSEHSKKCTPVRSTHTPPLYRNNHYSKESEQPYTAQKKETNTPKNISNITITEIE
jgi:hypothetical protein